MKRIISLLAAMAIMATLVVAMAVPAMAKNIKFDQGEPIVSGNVQNFVLHCKPFGELSGAELRGTIPSGANSDEASNCRFAK